MIQDEKMTQIANLITKSIKGELSKEESLFFSEWLKQSEKNKQLFDKLCNEEYVLGEYDIHQKINSGRAWQSVLRNRKRHTFNRYIKYAAVIIILIGFTFTYLIINNPIDHPQHLQQLSQSVQPGTGKAILVLNGEKEIKLDKKNNINVLDSTGTRIKNDSATLYYQKNISTSKQTNDYHTLITERGGEYNIILSDGTKVFMNSESKLRYPVVFNEAERKVYLEGEAYFEVSKDKQHPFIVEGKDFSVKVLGTSFNISDYKEDEITKIVLVEGSVQVNKDMNAYRLTPNQELTIQNGEFQIRKVNAVNAISWKNDKFYFSNERLEIVMQKLARWYDVQLFYSNQDIKNYHFSGFIPKYADITQAFTILELTCNIKFNLKDKTVIITQKN